MSRIGLKGLAGKDWQGFVNKDSPARNGWPGLVGNDLLARIVQVGMAGKDLQVRIEGQKLTGKDFPHGYNHINLQGLQARWKEQFVGIYWPLT